MPIIFLLATGIASAFTATSSIILWGAIAAAMVGAMTAYALDEKRKRKEQEANKLQEDYAKAAQLNAMEEDAQQQAAEPAQRVI